LGKKPDLGIGSEASFGVLLQASKPIATSAEAITTFNLRMMLSF
jgi:hypothetical protein